MIWRNERPRPESVRSWPHAWKLATATVCFGAFMGQLDASIVTLTYRPLERHFHASLGAVQWVSLSYLLTLLCLLAPVGRRSDQKGRKLSYLDGFVVFSAGSLACALAPNLPLLVASRALQGAGAAWLQANSVAIVTSVAPRGRLRTALGAQAAAQALGLAIGPTLGGLIVSTVGWRWVFAINVPIGLIALAAGVLFLPRTTERAPAAPIDSLGAMMIGLAATAALLTLSAGGGLRLSGALTGAIAATGVVAVAGLRRHLRVTTEPVVPPGVLNAPGIRTNLATALFTYWTLFGPLVLVPTLLASRGWSPVNSGLILTALPAGFAIAATIAGGALPRAWPDGHRTLLGAALATVALGTSVALPISAAPLVGILAVAGLGLGVLAPANNAQIMRAVPARATASAGAVLNMTRAMGTALGIAAVTLTLHLAGERAALVSVASAAALATATSGWKSAVKRVGPIMPQHAPRPGRGLARVSDTSHVG